MKKLMRVLAMLLVVMIFSVFVMGETKKVIVPIGQDGVQRVEVLGGSYFYEPNHIIVKKDIPVEMTIKKEPGIAPHDIVLQASEAEIDFSESLTTEPKIIMFTPRKPGKYNFYCSKRFLFFKSHRDQGMEGVLEVLD